MPYPIHVTAEYPNEQSRGLLILRVLTMGLYVAIPHGIILGVYGMAAFFATIVAGFSILFTKRYPKGMFDFVVGYHRWYTRVQAYMTLLTDKYPPFRAEE
ncbi:MAG: DUF4389 domain-containing protein [Candidatus Eisenbacteria bacterium]